MAFAAIRGRDLEASQTLWRREERSLMSRRSPVVVLAEDKREMRELVAETLVCEGYQVIQVASGVALLEVMGSACAQEYPDLVITDVRMPGLSGLDAIEQVRQVDPFIPVLVITAFGQSAAQGQAEALGVAAVIDKPFELEHLVEWVRRLAPLDPTPDLPPAE
jgi:CheY-like chemotaxis protein